MKVSIAASLVHNPSVLIYDEPFVNLDINTSNKLKNILSSLKGKKTLFITSHHLDLVVDICDKFIILDKGEIIENINKSDYDSNESLKKCIKKKMLNKDRVRNTNNINWLS